jgi:hypothetical protein
MKCFLFGVVTLASLITLTEQIEAANAPSKLIIGYAAMSARAVPLWIAGEQALFNKYGIDSEQIFIRGAPTLVAGLASGDITSAVTALQCEMLRGVYRELRRTAQHDIYGVSRM